MILALDSDIFQSRIGVLHAPKLWHSRASTTRRQLYYGAKVSMGHDLRSEANRWIWPPKSSIDFMKVFSHRRVTRASALMGSQLLLQQFLLGTALRSSFYISV